jgi:hypothetical protein
MVPKLSLRGHLEGLGVNTKYKVSTSGSLQRELYLNGFNLFFYVSHSLQCSIENALRWCISKVYEL